jgi:hypothetical protein
MTSLCARLSAKEQPPAADSGDRCRRRIVDAKALWRARRRGRSGTGLFLLGRIPYCPTVSTFIAEIERRCRRIQRRGVKSASRRRDSSTEPVAALPGASAAFRPGFGAACVELNESVSGDCGQTVKPGSTCATGEVAFTVPVVSM